MTQIRVRFAETDAAGIVHYGHYLAYLEAGRAEALRAVGLSSEMVAVCSLQAPVLEAVIRYRAPARFDDLLDITTWVLDVSESQFRWAYEIRRTVDQIVIATGETLHAWTEATAPEHGEPPAWLLTALELLRK